MTPSKNQKNAQKTTKIPPAGLLVGVDEVGRGTWAGPVVACAFIFLDVVAAKRSKIYKKLADSKVLSPAQRTMISDELHQLAKSGIVAFAFGEASEKDVDQVNVRQATKLAMGRALEGLLGPVGAAMMGINIVIDGKDEFGFFGLPKPRYLVRGDSQVREIMAASILAKVFRDTMMTRLDRRFPNYGFAKHKGYGTAQHAHALGRFGPCAIHRKTFAPVRASVTKKTVSIKNLLRQKTSSY